MNRMKAKRAKKKYPNDELMFESVFLCANSGEQLISAHGIRIGPAKPAKRIQLTVEFVEVERETIVLRRIYECA